VYDWNGANEHEAIVECINEFSLELQFVNLASVTAACLDQPQMHVPFDKEELGSGGMKNRIAVN
jgi:hypothetical protein